MQTAAQIELQQALATLEHTPAHGPSWLRAARAMDALGRPSDAITALRQATKLCPMDPDLHTALGARLAQASAREEPEACYRAALAIDPTHTDALVRLGLLKLNDAALDEAGQCFVTVLKRHPDHSAATAGAALVLDRRGLVDDAWKLLQDSPARPSNPLALATARVALHAGTQRKALRTLDARIPHAQGRDRAMLLFAKGDLHDTLGQHGAAWRAWKEGNTKRGLRFDPTAHERTIDTILAATAEPCIPTGPADPRPVFVVGMPRSGSTLVETILDSHPDVIGLGELEAVRDLAVAIPRWQGGGRTYFEHVDAWSALGPRLGQAYLDTVGVDAVRFVDKMPNNALHLGLIQVMLPGARVIWCERDPDDVALSCFQRVLSAGHSWAGSLAGIRSWQAGLQRLKAHWRATLDLPILDFAYEDLVADPDTKVRELADFVGIDFDPAMLSFHERKRRVKTSSWDQVTEKLHGRRVGRARPYARFLHP